MARTFQTVTWLTDMTDSPIVVVVIPTTGYAVLGLLSFDQALSGYDLKRWADHSLRYFFWSPAQSAIYTELRRLEELGLVRRSGAAGGPRNRQRYRITAAGRRELADWVGSSPTPATVVKDHALVKVWLGHMADRPRLTEVVATEHDAAEELLDEIRYSLEHAGATGHPTVVLVERYCERIAAARVEALDELQAALAAMPTDLMAPAEPLLAGPPRRQDT